VKKLIGLMVMAFVAGILVVGSVGCGDTAKTTTKDTKTSAGETKAETKTKE
jgi:hypothetical protein